MTPEKRYLYLRLAALLIIGLPLVFDTLFYGLFKIRIYYDSDIDIENWDKTVLIAWIVMVGLIFLVWKRPFIAGILLVALALLLFLWSVCFIIITEDYYNSGNLILLSPLLPGLLLLATRLVRPSPLVEKGG